MLFNRQIVSDSEFSQIKKLHILSLEDSMITLLGENVVENYYKFVSESEDDCLFLVNEKENVIGTCMLSHKPNSVTKRMAKKYPFLILFAVLKQILISSKNRKKIFQFLLKKSESPKSILGLPEVIQIFTDINYRNKKIGTRLIEQVETHLKNRNENKYYLKTFDDPNNLALLFYKKRNFREVGKNVISERPYVYFIKDC